MIQKFTRGRECAYSVRIFVLTTVIAAAFFCFSAGPAVSVAYALGAQQDNASTLMQINADQIEFNEKITSTDQTSQTLLTPQAGPSVPASQTSKTAGSNSGKTSANASGNTSGATTGKTSSTTAANTAGITSGNTSDNADSTSEGNTAASNGAVASGDLANSANTEDANKTSAEPEKPKPGWNAIDKEWYYYDAAGLPKTGWLKSGGKWYYLDAKTGAMQTGLINDNDVWYALDSKGAMATNKWIQLETGWYFASATGELKTGWLKSGGKWYYLDPANNGLMAVQTWVKDGNTRYYLSETGAMKTGWAKDGNIWYYLGNSGAATTGWKKIGGAWYYLDPEENGAMKTGRYQVNDTWYVSSASGAMASNNWAQDGSDWYYANASGELKTGWHKSGGKWYYLQPNKAGLMASGEWINDGTADYFMVKSGAMFTGWLNQGNANGLANGMYFDKQKMLDIALAEVGYLEKASNSQLDNKTANSGSANYTKYGRDMHAIEPGIMDEHDAWCDAFVDWCFVQAYGINNAKGLLGGSFNDYTVASAQLFKDQISWYTSNPQVGDQVFFKDSKGINHTGVVYGVNNGKIYTVEGNSTDKVAKREYVLTNNKIAGYGRPLYNNMDDNGNFVQAKEWCYLTSSGARASGWVKADGKWYYFDPATGRMQRGKKTIDGNTYYLSTDGTMKTGWNKENGKSYYYDTSGVMQKDAWIGECYVGPDGVMATNKWIGEKFVGADGKYQPDVKKSA